MLPSFNLQSGWSECRTGNGKKLCRSQAQLGQTTYLAVAQFLSVSCATSTPSTLYGFSESEKILACLIPGHEFSKQLVSQHVHVVQDGEVEPGAAVGALARAGFDGT